MTIDELRRDMIAGTLTEANAKAFLAALDVVEACVVWTEDHGEDECHLCGMRGGKYHDECPVATFEEALALAGESK